MIRPADITDIDQILALEEKLFDNSLNERMLHHELLRGAGWVVGAPIVGYVLVRTDTGIADITRLGVSPEAQGQGWGKKLLEVALSGKSDAMLTVRKDNVKALGLYRAYGFEVVGHLYAAQAWVMRRRVAA